MLPGILRERASGAPVGEILCAGAVAARALVAGGSVEAAPLSAAGSRAAAAAYGRFPPSFVGESATGFERLAARAARDDDALVAFGAPLLAAGLFAMEREARRRSLGSVPDPLATRVRREFETERSRGTLSEQGRMAALDCWVGAATTTDVRGCVSGAIAAVFGDVWADEVAVLAGDAWPPARFPRFDLEGREDLAVWWIEVVS